MSWATFPLLDKRGLTKHTCAAAAPHPSLFCGHSLHAQEDVGVPTERQSGASLYMYNVCVYACVRLHMCACLCVHVCLCVHLHTWGVCVYACTTMETGQEDVGT